MAQNLPEAIRGPGDHLYQALKKANEASRQGIPKQELDAYLLNRYGMTKAALTAAVKAMPKETPSRNMSEGEIRKAMLKAAAYGVTGGWSDEIAGLIGSLKGTGYAKARKTALEEMKQFEKEYPWLARGAKAYGLGLGALVGGVGGKALSAAGKNATLNANRAKLGLSGVYPNTMANTGLGLAGRSMVGAGVGANAGAGGMLGEDSGFARIPNAAAGALAGGAAGAGSMVPGNRIAKIAALLGAGAGAGAMGKKVLGFLTGN